MPLSLCSTCRRLSRTHDRDHEARCDARCGVLGVDGVACVGGVDDLMNAHTLTLARYIALRELRRQWHRQGVKLRQFDAHDLAKASKAYLSEHRAELIEKAQAQLGSLKSHN